MNPLAFSVGPPGFEPIRNAAEPSRTKRSNKITVVGVGSVGMAIAQTIILQELTDELVLVDTNRQKLRGETLDLQHANVFLPPTKIYYSFDYEGTAGSDLCIVTAGARQIRGESRMDLLRRNVALFHTIIPTLARFSPDSILMIVSNPVEALTYVAWKRSGFPPNRVIGSGTNLESSRFRFHIADRFGLNAQDVQAYILGTHGGSTMAPWSSVSIGGVPVMSFMERETFISIHQDVINSTSEVIRLKGYTSSATGYSVASLARSILRDERKIHTISVLAKGFYGIEGEVFLSLPAVLGREGVLGVPFVHLTEEEAQKLRESVAQGNFSDI